MDLTSEILWAYAALFCALLATVLWLLNRVAQSTSADKQRIGELSTQLERISALLESSDMRHASEAASTRDFLLAQLNQSRDQTGANLRELGERSADMRSALERRFGELQTQLLERLLQGTQALSKDVSASLAQTTEQLGKRVDGLTEATDKRLREISGHVDRRLQEGFEKTTSTFGEVLKRLALIDEAQRKITELSTDVVSLQQLLADKRARGAFGEIQLEALVKNALPDQHILLQHKLPNETRVDCLLRLPQPSGDICIDAKFPLENYQRMVDPGLAVADQATASRQFRADVKTHIQAVAGKYILPEITANGAIMFIPAESIFAEIHAHHPELVSEAHDRNVWMCSPSTLMAVLTTARAVLRDDALRQQAHLIRDYIIELNREFGRFRERMGKLAKHIRQAHEETERVHTTAKKITRRFDSIEQAHFEDGDANPELLQADSELPDDTESAIADPAIR